MNTQTLKIYLKHTAVLGNGRLKFLVCLHMAISLVLFYMHISKTGSKYTSLLNYTSFFITKFLMDPKYTRSIILQIIFYIIF